MTVGRLPMAGLLRDRLRMLDQHISHEREMIAAKRQAAAYSLYPRRLFEEYIAQAEKQIYLLGMLRRSACEQYLSESLKVLDDAIATE